MNSEIIKLFSLSVDTEKQKKIKKIRDENIEDKEINDFCNAYLLALDNKYKEALELINEYDTIESLYLKGSINYNLNNYEEAEKYYKLCVEKDENFAYPYNGLGTIYADLKKYEEAEKYYKLSIKKDENFAYPYNNLGSLYWRLKKYEEAEKCFKICIEKDENDSSSYNGLGVLYSELKKYDEAEKYYKLSIEKDENMEMDEDKSTPYFNLGIIYRNLKRYADAREVVNKGIEVLNLNKTANLENYFQARFDNLLTEIDNAEKVDKNYLTILNKEEDPLKKIFKSINDNKIDEQTFLNKIKFLNFIKPKQQKDSENYFKVLRRWNSYTPIIADNYHISKGGGYFFKINGFGIVIDPGFNFIENFKGAGHVFDEIDAVFVSHAHNDHTADLESILTLLYKYNEEIKDSDDLENTESIRHEIAREKNIDYSTVTQEEINKAFIASEKRKIIDIFLTASTLKKSVGLFELFNKNDYRIHLVEPDGKFQYKEIKVRVLKAKHHDIVSDYFSVGFAFYIKDTVLIYTGDTAWNVEIENQYKDLAEETKSDYKILIAHIGGFKEYENLYLNEGYSGYDAFYKNHLGRLGIGKLNETLQPDVFLMSEFGEEIKGSRIKLCEIYEKAYKGFAGKNIKFFPADIGFKINLDNKKIFGVSSIKQYPDELIYDYLKQSEIRIAELRKDCSLNYYKSNSNFTESTLIQILADNFDESRK